MIIILILKSIADEDFGRGEASDALDGGFGDDRLEGCSDLFVEEVFSLRRESFQLIWPA